MIQNHPFKNCLCLQWNISTVKIKGQSRGIIFISSTKKCFVSSFFAKLWKYQIGASLKCLSNTCKLNISEFCCILGLVSFQYSKVSPIIISSVIFHNKSKFNSSHESYMCICTHLITALQNHAN